MGKNNYKMYRKPECPWGKKAETLFKERDITFEDHAFGSKEEEKKFKEEHSVQTTPQIFEVEKRVGGYTELAKKLGIEVAEEKSPYTPVIAVFSVAALMAIAVTHPWNTSLSLSLLRTWMMSFMGFSLCILATLKLMDVASFYNGFEKYDLLTQAIPVYGKMYPFLELALGLGFLTLFQPFWTGFVSLLIGAVGGFSVFKAVYLDKKDLNCSCVGGNTDVPLGAVSFSENAIMALMGIFLLAQTLV